MIRFLGICGPEGGGKSTVAKMLRDEYGATIVPFAEPLKRMIEALGIEPRHLYGTPADKLEALEMFGGKSARYAMQTLGTEWGRAMFGADFWVHAWQQRADATQGLIVSDDVRFDSETAAIHRNGGAVICVVRSRDDFDRVPYHASENFAALRHNHIVLNNGSLAGLRQRVRAIASGYGLGELQRELELA